MNVSALSEIRSCFHINQVLDLAETIISSVMSGKPFVDMNHNCRDVRKLSNPHSKSLTMVLAKLMKWPKPFQHVTVALEDS